MRKLLDELSSNDRQADQQNDAQMDTNLSIGLANAGLLNVKYALPYLETIYFLKLMQFIGANNAKLMKDQKQSLLNARRKSHAEQNWPEYNLVVQKLIELDEEHSVPLIIETLQLLKIDQEIFDRTYQSLGESQNYGEAVLLACQGKLLKPETAKLSKELTLQIIKMHQDLALKQIAN